jgi:hypothetical protein
LYVCHGIYPPIVALPLDAETESGLGSRQVLANAESAIGS